MFDAKSLQILQVDDSRSLRVLLRNVLRGLRMNLEIVEAADGEEAIRSYKASPSDIVLLDIKMPGITGIEVLEQLKKLDPYAFVVMLTSNKTNDWVIKAKNLGANGYIAKPFRSDKLLRVFKDYERFQKVKETIDA